MSRAAFIKQRLKAKKRKLLFMRGGILGAGLCVFLFFVSIPDATSGTNGFAERKTPVDPISEEQVVKQDASVDSSQLVSSDSMSQEEPIKSIAEASIEAPLEATPTTETSTPPAVDNQKRADLEGGSRSTEGENKAPVVPQSDPPTVRFESPESVLGNPQAEVVNKPEEKKPVYMDMPSYESATLKYKLGLIGSDAYSPSDKEVLNKHILAMFPNPNVPVETVYLEAGGQQSTKSFPLKLYLLRLEQNPSIRVRSIEEVREGGSLSGLIIKE
ncbi:MAG: hypothetical protein AAFN10_26800 [Bacteroidota bacterium]